MRKTKIIITILSIVAIVSVVAVLIFAGTGKETSEYEKYIEASQKYVDELNYEKAIAELELAIEIEPTNAQAYIALAEVYEKMGDYDSAVKVLEEAKEKANDASDADKALEELKESEILNNQLNDTNIANNDIDLERDELNSYLSIFSRYELDGYSVNDPDFLQLLSFAFYYLEYETQVIWETETDTVALKSDIDDVMERYFDLTIPERNYDYYLYDNGTFLHPQWDYGFVFGTSLSVAEKIEINDRGNYVVEFTNLYVDFDGLETGKINPKTIDDYYKYNMEQIKEDPFCEIRQTGKCEIKRLDGRLILLEYILN